MNLSCDAVEWSGSGQVTVTLIVADFQLPEDSPRVECEIWSVLGAYRRVLLPNQRSSVLLVARDSAVICEQRRECQDLMSRKKAN